MNFKELLSLFLHFGAEGNIRDEHIAEAKMQKEAKKT